MKLKFLPVLLIQFIIHNGYCSDISLTEFHNSISDKEIREGRVKRQIEHDLNFYKYGHKLSEVTKTTDGLTKIDELRSQSFFKPLIDDLKSLIDYRTAISSSRIKDLNLVKRFGKAQAETLIRIAKVNLISMNDLERWGLGCLVDHDSDKLMAHGTYRLGNARSAFNETDLTDLEGSVKKVSKLGGKFTDIEIRTEIAAEKLLTSFEKMKDVLYNEYAEYDDIYAINQYHTLMNRVLKFVRKGDIDSNDEWEEVKIKMSPYNQHVMLNKVLNYIIGVENAFNQYILQNINSREYIDYGSIKKSREKKGIYSTSMNTPERFIESLTGGIEKQLEESIKTFFNVLDK